MQCLKNFIHTSHCFISHIVSGHFFKELCQIHNSYKQTVTYIPTYYFYNNRLTGRQHKYLSKLQFCFQVKLLTPLKVNEKGAKTILLLNMLNLKKPSTALRKIFGIMRK